MALLVLLVGSCAALLDYLLKASAAAALDEKELLHFFSWFYIAVGLGSFLLQGLLGKRLLRGLGISGTLGSWPLFILIGSVGVAFFQGLMSIALLRAASAVYLMALASRGQTCKCP
jgi:hypothetical protein